MAVSEIKRKSKFDQVPLDTIEWEIVKKYAPLGPPDPKKKKEKAKA